MVLPQSPDDEFDFDFAYRQAQLNTILEKWLDSEKPKEASKYTQTILSSLVDLIFDLIDEGHPKGEETIKRNFELAELAGGYCGSFSLAGYCLGLEYGSQGLQPAPVIDAKSIPKEVKEMFIVAFQPMYDLHLKLIGDIYRARQIDEHYVDKKLDEFNLTAFEVLTSCYRLGIATGMEEFST